MCQGTVVCLYDLGVRTMDVTERRDGLVHDSVENATQIISIRHDGIASILTKCQVFLMGGK